jgi:hypothetical protein
MFDAGPFWGHNECALIWHTFASPPFKELQLI